MNNKKFQTYIYLVTKLQYRLNKVLIRDLLNYEKRIECNSAKE